MNSRYVGHGRNNNHDRKKDDPDDGVIIEWLKVCAGVRERLHEKRGACDPLLHQERAELALILDFIHSSFPVEFGSVPNDLECAECATAIGLWEVARKNARQELHLKEGSPVPIEEIQKRMPHDMRMHLDTCKTNLMWDIFAFAELMNMRAKAARLQTEGFIRKAFIPLLEHEEDAPKKVLTNLLGQQFVNQRYEGYVQQKREKLEERRSQRKLSKRVEERPEDDRTEAKAGFWTPRL